MGPEETPPLPKEGDDGSSLRFRQEVCCYKCMYTCTVVCAYLILSVMSCASDSAGTSTDASTLCRTALRAIGSGESLHRSMIVC